jgi:hypothetical protein
MVECGLYLENTKRKAARNVLLVLRATATPQPEGYRFLYKTAKPEMGSTYRNCETRGAQQGVWVRFSDALVVYEEAVYVGDLILRWTRELSNEQLPTEIVVAYDVYSLDGAYQGKMKLSVEWK